MTQHVVDINLAYTITKRKIYTNVEYNFHDRCTYLTLQAVFFFSRIGHLQDPVTWYGINYTGTQMTQWDFQNKGTLTSPARLSFVLKVPLRHLRPSVIYSVPCDWILQMVYFHDTMNYCGNATNSKQVDLRHSRGVNMFYFSGLSFRDTRGSEFFRGLSFRDTRGSEFFGSGV